MPDRRILSLPIPADDHPHRLGQLQPGNVNLGTLVADLTRRKKRPRGGHTTVHLDPDLDGTLLPRPPGWRPAFGTVPPALTHLENEGVEEGDLFLFFGWFRQVEWWRQAWRYVPGAPHLHLIFGWLQVGEIVRIDDRVEQVRRNYPWLRDHPHVACADEWEASSNAIYVAADRLVLNGRAVGLPGGGLCKTYRPELQLTKDGMSRSHWRLPRWFLPRREAPTLSCHRDRSRWTCEGEHVRLHSVPIGQEFVLDCDQYSESIEWIRSILPAGN